MLLDAIDRTPTIRKAAGTLAAERGTPLLDILRLMLLEAAALLNGQLARPELYSQREVRTVIVEVIADLLLADELVGAYGP